MHVLIQSALMVLLLATTGIASAVGTNAAPAPVPSPANETIPPDQETLRVLTEAEKNSPFNNTILRQIAKTYQTEILCMIAKQ